MPDRRIARLQERGRALKLSLGRAVVIRDCNNRHDSDESRAVATAEVRRGALRGSIYAAGDRSGDITGTSGLRRRGTVFRRVVG
jgi:hypothetical protein